MLNPHRDAPDYWFGVGQAPNFSRRVAQADEDVKRAEEKLTAALKHAYPLGEPVSVIHHRGHFTATVAGWDSCGCRVVVKNDATGKVSKWWAAHVQLRAQATPQPAANPD